jgi:hypothetical protein
LTLAHPCDKASIALVLHNLGAVAHVQGQSNQAARLFAGAAALRDAIQGATPQSLTNPADWEHDIAAVRAVLGDDVFRAAWAEGRAMTLEQAIEYALADELNE